MYEAVILQFVWDDCISCIDLRGNRSAVYAMIYARSDCKADGQ